MVIARSRVSTLKQPPDKPAASASGCPCARPCPAMEHISPLMSLGESVRFRRGEVFWQAGTPAHEVLVVCSGLVKLSRPRGIEGGEGEGARELILDLLHRGQLAGEESTQDHAVYNSTATALSSGRAIRLSRAQLLQRLDESPRLLWTLLHTSLQRTQRISERAQEGGAPVQQRLAHLLLRLSAESGLDDARGRFLPLPLRRGDLADLITCRVETAIRLMTQWQRDAIVETHREGFVIKDLEALRACAAGR